MLKKEEPTDETRGRPGSGHCDKTGRPSSFYVVPGGLGRIDPSLTVGAGVHLKTRGHAVKVGNPGKPILRKEITEWTAFAKGVNPTQY